MTSIPSLNVTPRTSFGNWLWPSRRRQLFCAASSSLKTIASAVLLDRQPFDRIVFAIIRFRSNLTACGTRQASAIQYRDVRSLTCRKLAALRWLKPSLAIAAPYCWPVMALSFTIVWAFCRMHYQNTRIQVLVLRANDLRFRASRPACVEAAAHFLWRAQ